jgi:hypothetical protein
MVTLGGWLRRVDGYAGWLATPDASVANSQVVCATLRQYEIWPCRHIIGPDSQLKDVSRAFPILAISVSYRPPKALVSWVARSNFELTSQKQLTPHSPTAFNLQCDSSKLQHFKLWSLTDRYYHIHPYLSVLPMNRRNTLQRKKCNASKVGCIADSSPFLASTFSLLQPDHGVLLRRLGVVWWLLTCCTIAVILICEPSIAKSSSRSGSG